MSPDGRLFLSSWSDIKTPTRERLYRARWPARPHDRLQPVLRAEAAQVWPARAVPDLGPRRIFARGRADFAPRSGLDQKVPRLVQDLRRSARPVGIGKLGRRPDVGSGAGARRVCRLRDGPPHAPAARGPLRPGKHTSTWESKSSRISRTRSTGSSKNPMSTERVSGWPVIAMAVTSRRMR